MDNGACDAFFGQQSLERKQAVTMLLTELDKAERKFPTWPDDLVHRAAIVAEEAGELVRASLQNQYEGDRLQELKKEATQTGAVALRFLTKLPARAFVVLAMFWTFYVQAQSPPLAPSQGGGNSGVDCQVSISTNCHSMCVPGTFKIDTAFCGWFVMTANGAQSYTWNVSSGQSVVDQTIAVYPGNPGVVDYTVTGTGTSTISGQTCTSQAVISITNVICANGTPLITGLTPIPSPEERGVPLYYDLYGNAIEKRFKEVIIEQVGLRRRKVVFE